METSRISLKHTPRTQEHLLLIPAMLCTPTPPRAVWKDCLSRRRTRPAPPSGEKPPGHPVTMRAHQGRTWATGGVQVRRSASKLWCSRQSLVFPFLSLKGGRQTLSFSKKLQQEDPSTCPQVSLPSWVSLFGGGYSVQESSGQRKPLAPSKHSHSQPVCCHWLSR